jgi:O-antigen ligase
VQFEATADTALFANHYVRAESRRKRWLTVWSLVLAVALGAICGLSPVAPFALLVAIAVPLLFWRYPHACLYLVFGAVCTIEAYALNHPDSLTDRIPIFWNLNTIVQVYAHADFHGVPLNLLEILLLTSGFISLLQSVYLRRVKLRVGPLAAPIFFYIFFVLLGLANGLATGGDFNFSLLEVRPPLYFCLAYLLTTNLAREEKVRTHLLWLTAACIALKGVLYSYRLFVTMHGTIPDQGVGSHEEVFFFDAFFVLLLLLSLTGASPRLRTLMGLMALVVATGQLACNRRAGIAALIIALPVLMILGYAALPSRRRLIGSVGVVIVLVASVYYPVFRNKTGMWAQPAQAIKSAFEPDSRDASSDAYREGENDNLMATIKAAPIQGWGYGKRMVIVTDLSFAANLWEFWDKLPHNTMLWIWMRTGTLGFFAFWMMFASILIYGCQTVQDAESARDQATALWACTVLVIWVVIGLFDMGFTQVRPVMFSGFVVGLLTCIPRKPRPLPSPAKPFKVSRVSANPAH